MPSQAEKNDMPKNVQATFDKYVALASDKAQTTPNTTLAQKKFNVNEASILDFLLI